VTVTVNPVLARELRQRMRGPRAFIVLTIYLGLLSVIVWAMYEGVSRTSSSFNGPNVEQIAGLGRSVFQTLLFCVLALVCFIVPGLTAGAIAGERERQTLVPLQVTMLRSRSILFGKLIASLAFVALLIVATLPLAGITFLLGGVEPGEVLKGTAMVSVVALVLACLSLFCSTFMRRTQGATVMSYGVVFALVLGTFVVFAIQAVFTSTEAATRNQMVLQVNPFMAVADVLDDQEDILSGGSGFSPFTPMQALLRERDKAEERIQNGQAGVIIDGPGPPGLRAPVVQRRDGRVAPRERPLNTVPFFAFSLLAYAGLAAGSLALAARRLAVPRAA
jgi:ABC-type transport system involved in multi-copper enzyme maturation permease subunit